MLSFTIFSLPLESAFPKPVGAERPQFMNVQGTPLCDKECLPSLPPKCATPQPPYTPGKNQFHQLFVYSS